MNTVKNDASQALTDVLAERARQDKKWGEQNHDPFTYLVILMEEIGELSQASVQTRYGGRKGGDGAIRKEAIHTAAVALAIVECLDRKRWAWSKETKPDEMCPECGSIEEKHGCMTPGKLVCQECGEDYMPNSGA